MTVTFKKNPAAGELGITTQTVENGLDNCGLILGLPRLTGERNAGYRDRLLDVMVHRANSTYRGLVNGVTRELDLEMGPALEIDIKPIVDGFIDGVHVGYTETTLTDAAIGLLGYADDEMIGFTLKIGKAIFRIATNTGDTVEITDGSLATAIGNPVTGDATTYAKYEISAVRNPRVDIVSGAMYLYDSYTDSENYSRAAKIELSENNSIQDVITAINDLQNFQATASGIFDLSLPSFLLIRTSSTGFITEPIVGTRVFKLKYNNIIEGTLFFSDLNSFHTEVSSIDDIATTPNSYFVDNPNGIVYLDKSIQAVNSTVRYSYIEFPLAVEASEVAVNSIADREMRRQLFRQIPLSVYDSIDDMTVDGVPRPKMLAYIKELLGVADLYWGKS